MDKIDYESVIQNLTQAIVIEDQEKIEEGLRALKSLNDPWWLEGYNFLCTAYKNKKYEFADALLTLDFFQVNNKLEENENTPLHWAVINNFSHYYLKFIKNLLNRGADMNRENSLGQNSFDLALRKQDLPVLELLVNHINDENITKKTYLKLLFDLIERDYVDLTEKLLTKCAYIDIKKSMSDFNFLILAVKKRQYKVIKSLLERGIDINYYDKSNVDSVTAIFTACAMGDLKMVKFLLDNKADTDIETMAYYHSLRYYPIHIAIMKIAFHGKDVTFNIVKELLDRGENVDKIFYENVSKESRDLKTSLHLACRNNDLNIVKLLIERGADLHSGSIKSGMPILEAFGEDNPDDDQEIEVMTYLLGLENLRLNLATATTMFIKGAENNKFRKMNLIFDYIKRLNPTHHLRYELDINIFNNGNLNRPLIHRASRYSYEESIELFIKNGLDVNLKNLKGQTALHVAFRYRKYDSIVKLIKYGADIHVACNEGFLPVEYTLNHKIRESRFDTDDDENEYEDFSENDLDKIANYFGHHVIKLKYLNLYFNDKNYSFAMGNLDHPFKNQEKYGKEISKMNETIINSLIPNITYYNFVKGSLNRRMNFLNNPPILRTMNARENYSTKFPEFADIISNLFHQALFRKKLLDKFYETPIYEFLNKNLAYLCVKEIVDYFNNRELKDVVNMYTFFG